MSVIALPPPAFSPPTRTASVTPEDVLALEQQGLFELVNGELVEKPTIGFFANDVAGELFVLLRVHGKANGQGTAVFETSFQCFPRKPSQTRRPDIAFIAAARLIGVSAEGNVAVRPDLAVEVISPNDDAEKREDKLVDYESAGIPLVWVIYPTVRVVRVYRLDGSSRKLTEADTLDGGDVLPGFSVAVRDLFPPPG